MRTDRNPSKTERIAIALIVSATIVAYIPAMRAGFIWDDPDYVVNNLTLRTLGGLADIWFSPRSLPQYYPMVHTSFWLEFHLWQLNPAGYHIVNILLHALAVVLLWRLLIALQIPGAWLAAGIFALHPVHVESVAWITERKNVLSAVFYLASFLAYVKSPPPTGEAAGFSRRWYAISLALFIAALLSKSVTCSLPAAVLLVIWWKRGRITRQDLKRLALFLILGIGMAVTTAWLERAHVGARGHEWDLSFLERCLIAGRAVSFYVMKLVAPLKLTFIYPRWDIDPQKWWQYVFPIAVIGVVLVLALNRKRLGRGAIAAVLFFIGTLFPALGFFNIYPMRYSFIADHFQYHASIGLIVLFSAVVARTARKHEPLLAVLLIPLAILTWRQAHIYRDLETLWRDTISKNPNSWMPHMNLASTLFEQKKLPEALAEFELAQRLGENVPETHRNVGVMRVKLGDVGGALVEIERALKVDPTYPPAYFTRADIAFERGDIESAKRDYAKAVELWPLFAEAHNGLGKSFARQRRLPEARVHYEQALRINPTYAEAHLNLAGVLVAQGNLLEARRHINIAMRLDPTLRQYAEKILP